MIPQSFIDDLLARLDIVDVVSRYVPLKKAGRDYKACCPFHNEKSPSFTVSPDKGFYHCFGCGANGSALSFVMEHAGLGFVEAVEQLAGEVGLTVPQESGGQDTERARPTRDALELMAAASRYYKQQLKASPRAIAYLKGRGLSGQIAARFGLGFAPEGWQNLEAVADDYQTSKLLLETGLIVQNEQGRRYDRFRDRVMFPIINSRGQIIGFGGRILDKGEPKYLNSPETPWFEKGRELYGLYQARTAIRDQGRALVTEGYMDVVALAQYGIEYAVATLGTATTPEHIRKLMRQTEHIIFCFDGDRAGRKAAWRALETVLPVVTDALTCDFVFLPEEHDPDSYIRAHGTDGFETYLQESRLSLSAFWLHELSGRVDMSHDEGRARLVHEAKPYLAQLQQAPTLALLMRKRLAELTGVDLRDLNEVVGRAPRQKPSVVERQSRPLPSLPRQLLAMLLTSPALHQQLPRELLTELRDDGDEGALRRALEILAARPHIVQPAVLLHALQAELPAGLLDRVLREQNNLPADEEQGLTAEFDGAVQQLRKNLGNRELDQLKSKLQTQGLSGEETQRFAELCRRESTPPKS